MQILLLATMVLGTIVSLSFSIYTYFQHTRRFSDLDRRISEISQSKEIIPKIPVKISLPGNLTHMEREIAKLWIKEHTAKQIADHFNISTRTVEKHISNIYRKTETNSQIALLNKLIDISFCVSIITYLFKSICNSDYY